MITIELNYDNWPLYDDDMRVMECIVQGIRAKLRDRWTARGYLYLENIYSEFELKWDSKKENILYDAKHEPQITYETNTVYDSITVKIR